MNKANVKLYLPYLIGALVFLALVVLYGLELIRYQRMLAPRWLVVSSLAVGLIPGYFIAQHFTKPLHDLTERIQLYLFFMIFCALFGPLFGAWANRGLSPNPMRIESVYFIKEEPYANSRFGWIKGPEPGPTGYFCFFLYDGAIHRIPSPMPLATGLQKGDTLHLRMGKGLFGFEWVDLPIRSKN